MFGLFKSSPFVDPQLGTLLRSRGLWRGSIAVPQSGEVPLAISGSRTEPDGQAVVAAREMAASFPSWRPAIERALFEHLGPYAQAVAEGDVALPADVWPHASLVFVSVTSLAGTLTTELGYTTAWDEEHTLGVRFQSGRFVELCGSVLPP